MKKQIAILAVLATPLASAMEMKMPTVYGKVNKVIAYTDQDAINATTATANGTSTDIRKSMDGVSDVGNSETRLGVKGDVATMSEAMKASYKVELGLNSSKNGSGDYGRMRIRLAEVALKSNYGSVTLGQTYNPFSKIALAADPMSETVAGIAGADQSERIRLGGNSGFGYRGRVDGLTYATPSFMGLTYTVSTDKNNKMSNVSGNSEYGATHYEHVLGFKRDLGGLDLNVYAGYHTWAQASMKSNSEMMYGLGLKKGAFSFNFTMTQEENEYIPTTSKKETTDRMFAALSYAMDKHTVSFSYQTRENRNVNGTDKNEDADITQMAVGYKHQCSENIDLNLTALTYEVKDKTTATGEAKKANENKATMVAAGIQLKF